MDDLGTLSPVDVRAVWKSEPSDFTPWLAENADLLGEALGLELVDPRTEQGVGRYSADLVLREQSTDRLVVVENMLDPTNHDHLGKLITYAAGLDARYVVLIAPDYREEHRSALNWLNSISADDLAFFGVVLEVYRIGDSPCAPSLRVEVKPDSWRRLVKEAQHDSEVSDRSLAYQRFWTEFLSAFTPSWPNKRKPVALSWIGFGSGRTGFTFNAAFCQPEVEYRLRAEMYIDLGDKEANKRAFDRLCRDKKEIEEAVGESLAWDRLDGNKASRISLYYADPIEITDEERWPDAREWLIDALGRMRKAFSGKLDVSDGDSRRPMQA